MNNRENRPVKGGFFVKCLTYIKMCYIIEI